MKVENTGAYIPERTFDESVKRMKAVEWLIMNDPIVRSAYEHAKRSPSLAIIIAADYGALLEAKIVDAMSRVEVTEHDRTRGYNSRFDA